jgi:hypothetical protein
MLGFDLPIGKKPPMLIEVWGLLCLGKEMALNFKSWIFGIEQEILLCCYTFSMSCHNILYHHENLA